MGEWAGGGVRMAAGVAGRGMGGQRAGGSILRGLDQTVGDNAEAIVRAEIDVAIGEPQPPEGILCAPLVKFSVQKIIVQCRWFSGKRTEIRGDGVWGARGHSGKIARFAAWQALLNKKISWVFSFRQTHAGLTLPAFRWKRS